MCVVMKEKDCGLELVTNILRHVTSTLSLSHYLLFVRKFFLDFEEML